MNEQSPNTPYGSARDLPSFIEMAEQIRGMKFFTLLIGRKHRTQLIEIESQLHELVDTVDRFYERLGDRNWIFHDELNLEQIKVALNADPSPESLEQHLVLMYQEPETLELMVRRLNSLPELRIRQPLVKRAIDDYRAERYYATTLVLLTVMDGFVNDLESKRTGLHARSPEDLVAWDSVVGHHKGLSHAHRLFIKSTGKTTEAETFELQRHGILHGTVLNYDNVIVATKAWNRLFAVADWARSMQRQSQPIKQQPTLRETLEQARQRQRDKKEHASWRASTLTPSDDGFEQASVTKAVRDFLDSWRRRNYGAMSTYLPDRLLSGNPAAKPARVRELFDQTHLDDYQVSQLNFVAAAVCEIEATILVDGQSYDARLRWIREKPGTTQPAIREVDGVWRLCTWTPQAMFKNIV